MTDRRWISINADKNSPVLPNPPVTLRLVRAYLQRALFRRRPGAFAMIQNTILAQPACVPLNSRAPGSPARPSLQSWPTFPKTRSIC